MRLLLLAIATALFATAGHADPVRFDWVETVGIQPGPAPGPGEYRNPVLPGFYSDPSIVRVGATFYLVASTFAWFPGIPVFQSRDLVHWHQVGNAIDRPGQLRLNGLDMSSGVFAASISFHAGRFFIINTCVRCGGNFVITATDPAGPWSDPVWLKDVGGIDPSIFFDDDGTAWIVNNDAPPGHPRYDGHRAIWLHAFDWRGLRTTGEPRLLVDGGVDPASNPVWIEGPHLYKRGGRYYLMAAEGGTAANHSEVIFSAASLADPFRPAPASREPILTQRDLPPGRPAPVTATGHADLVDIGDDRWWAVFLATRPYQGDLYNTGRETFLLPVTWADGWPTILPKGRAVPLVATAPPLPHDRRPRPGNIQVTRFGFTARSLDPSWMMMRTPSTRWYGLDGHGLTLVPQAAGIGDTGNPSFLGQRQAQADSTVTTRLHAAPGDGQQAGLAAVQNDRFFLTGLLVRRHGRLSVEVRRRAGADNPAAGVLVAAVAISRYDGGPLRLRIHARGGSYDFDWATANGRWQPVAHDVDGTNLSTAKAGGFVGTLIGPYARNDRGSAVGGWRARVDSNHRPQA